MSPFMFLSFPLVNTGVSFALIVFHWSPSRKVSMLENTFPEMLLLSGTLMRRSTKYSKSLIKI